MEVLFLSISSSQIGSYAASKEHRQIFVHLDLQIYYSNDGVRKWCLLQALCSGQLSFSLSPSPSLSVDALSCGCISFTVVENMQCHIREQQTLLLSNTDLIKGRTEPQPQAQRRRDKDRDLRRDLMDEKMFVNYSSACLMCCRLQSPIKSPLGIQITGLLNRHFLINISGFLRAAGLQVCCLVCR